MRKIFGMLLATVAGLVVLTGCGLRDFREGADGAGGAPDPALSETVAPKAPVPQGKPLDAGAKVPAPPQADDQDATAVARAWATTAYGHDTAYDAGPQDAVLRAARYLTDERAAAEREHRSAGGTGNDWNVWAEHKAWTTVQVSVDDDAHDGEVPPDSPTVVYRVLYVEGKAQGRDGWSGAGPLLTAALKLSRSADGGPWRVADVQVTPAAVPPSPAPPATSPAPQN